MSAALIVLAAAAGCESTTGGEDRTPITSGTIGGLSFTVAAGTIYQETADGPLEAGSDGGLIVFDEDAGGLGMSDPQRLRIHSHFQLEDGGSIQVLAFGVPDDGLATGHSVELERDGTAIGYRFLLRGTLFAEGDFDPAPADASTAFWTVTEFYAQSVPGYGGGPNSGITMWGLDVLETGFADDVLGCSPGPAIEGVGLTGDRIGVRLRSGMLLAVAVADSITGPCE